MDLTLEDRIKEIVVGKLEEHNIKCDSINIRVIYDVRSVGVQGDARTYKHPVEVGISKNGEMIWNTKFIREISTEITNQIKEVNRVVYIIQ